MEISVSIVEDDMDACDILVEWLTTREREFKCVSLHRSAEQAVMHLPMEKPSIVLMDINLPGASGVEGVRRLKPLLPDTQFLMLTVCEDIDHVFDALTAGATGYLLKQTRRDDLLEAIRDVHSGGAPMTSHIARRVVQAFQRPVNALHVPNLSHREREVLELLACGYLYKEIAGVLQIETHTVNSYVRRIYGKLHVRSRAQAAAKINIFHIGPSSFSKVRCRIPYRS